MLPSSTLPLTLDTARPTASGERTRFEPVMRL